MNRESLKLNVNSIICFLGVILLFTPKVNLISFEGETAGIRIDDFIIAMIGLLIASIYIVMGKKLIHRVEVIFIVFTLIGFFSNIINVLIYNRSSLLYSFRAIEYFVFFYIGYLSETKISIKNLSYAYIIISGFIILLQLFGLLGGFRSEGYFSDVSSRPVGLTGGPWEVGVLLMYTLSIVIYSNSKQYNKILVVLFVFFLLLFTGARLPTLSFLVVIGIWVYSTTKNKLLLVFATSFAISIFIILLSQIDNTVTNRSSNLFSYSNIDQFIVYYRNIKINSLAVEFPEMPYDENSDLSWLFRVSKWSYAIKYWFEYYSGYIIGLGPGTWGFALDGGWIRIVTEYGLIGFIIFLMLLKEVAKIHPSLKMITITLAINMVMIDIHMAYKCMAFFFFTIGFLVSRKDKNKYLIELE